jgi:D-aminopeptidase
MMAGLDAGADAVLFVGYHARAGSGPAVLAHTMSDAILEVRLNGRPVGEIGLNAAWPVTSARRWCCSAATMWPAPNCTSSSRTR